MELPAVLPHIRLAISSADLSGKERKCRLDVYKRQAKGSDIIALSDAVRASVREKFGIDIHPEVNFV